MLGHLGLSMLNIIELQEDLIGMDHRPPKVFPAIVGQYSFYLQIMSLIKRQDSIIEDIHSGLRKLRRPFGKILNFYISQNADAGPS